MRRGFLLIALGFLSFRIWAQDFPSEIWHEGRVVLTSGDTLHGSIKYSIENDLIQVDMNNTVQTYSSRKIAYFEIFDLTVDNFRHFYSLPFSTRPNYRIPILFEVLYEGPMALLARELIVLETVPQINYSYRSYTRRKLTYEYYFLEQGSEIVRYSGKKNDLIYIMRKQTVQIKKFIKKNKLHYDRRNDLIKITTYYNNLLEAS